MRFAGSFLDSPLMRRPGPSILIGPPMTIGGERSHRTERDSVSIRLSDPTLLKTQAYIDGKWVDSDSGETYAVNNPANGKGIADVAKCGAQETRRAIEAADEAMKSWRRKSVLERASIMRKWFNLMMQNQEDLAQIMTAEQGKPLAE
jgi:succinate-semialdehyde dehydrogenase/glutarate-semialdehyde dehydrogenase